MSGPHTTAGWARALTASLTAALTRAAAGTALPDAARRLLLTGEAGTLNVNRGFATTKFPLPDGRVARPRLLVAELTDADWDRVETALRARPDAVAVAGTAAVSDRLTDPAHTGGVPLVPGPEDISPTCTCVPEAADAACPHSVALGMLLADRLRTAPAVLFTLRGRPHQHVKKRLRASGTDPGHPGPPTPGVPVSGPSPTAPARTRPPAPVPAQAQAQATEPGPPLPPAPPLPGPADLDLTGARPVRAGSLTAPPAPLPAAEALDALAADAAHRAGALLDGREPPAGSGGGSGDGSGSDFAPCSDPGGDIARFLALPHGAPFRQVAMDHLGLDLVGMGHYRLAHTHGGPGGAAAYLQPFAVGHDVLDGARDRVQPLRPATAAPLACEDNRLTDEDAGVQLRYGPDGRWHPYRAPYGIWQPVPGPSADPARAYRAARAAGRTNRRTS
ncbi:hypothetical protein [Streptomyces prasinopilosus]|uniref:Uncharacterized conserved protein, contains Zn finger domain n=1 Tax=Streptomyces prasinopilosus TaxID=67344 RepID=A0A1G6JC70_9ACTN|nr:hypothetical protein [Streptomyces prasinopilosus]SDC16269.1 Uncharacterized conserved protein, contains Zn finger domain [Streptomyces prasinopilosus]